ncbi:MAG TPA: hypothetical protein VED37_09050 [Ktedonobacteraceae bacterium]|nr:hypothetical protein [Ktedonobacteraceae bacterium]
MKQMMINLHIEELLLRDVPYALRHRVAAAFEHELARLLSEQDLPQSITQSGYIPLIDLGTMHITPDAKPDAIGTQIAQRVYGRLSNNEA